MRINLAVGMFIVLLSVISCESQSTVKLDNTTWFDDKHDDCTSRLEFKTDGDLIAYYCALDESFDARYNIEGDTIVINEYHMISQAPGSNGETEIRFVYKYIFESDKLVQVYYDDLKYPNPQIGRDYSFVFEKSK